MALSFLFGKKKTPIDVDSNTTRETSPNDEDFVVIERRSGNPGANMYPILGGAGAATLPYQVQPLPTITSGGSENNTEVHSSNFLDDVPFKLSSTLSGGATQWTKSDAAHFKSVMFSAVHNVEKGCLYEFNVERAVMRDGG